MQFGLTCLFKKKLKYIIKISSVYEYFFHLILIIPLVVHHKKLFHSIERLTVLLTFGYITHFFFQLKYLISIHFLKYITSKKLLNGSH